MATKFIPGQEVYVLNVHACGASDYGVIVMLARNKPYLGKYWVQVAGTQLAIEPERLIDAATYIAEQRAARASNR